VSIGKLAVGQADYYLEQAQGSVTRAGAVSSGAEDYYLNGPEAAGVWVGDGVRAVGLGGTVDALRLDRVLSGCAPVTGEPLGRAVPRRVPGFDLTFSAPKSVSVLFGIGDDGVRGAIQHAHDQAVREALAYVEREAGVTRRGAGGASVIAGRGLIGAAFRHRTSRAGDPQLHTHVLVANLVLGADGRWGTLDGRRIYAHAKTAGYLYEHRLRTVLTRELGFEWEPVRNGIADVAGVSPAVRRAFSRRRVEIQAEMARRGATSAGAAQVAALATRQAKAYRVAPERLAPEWRERRRRSGSMRLPCARSSGECAGSPTRSSKRCSTGSAARTD
jgi:conjugative relaxase-like TrwC/TraI family protein